MSISREDFEIGMLRIHDRFDRLEQMLNSSTMVKMNLNKKTHFDNVDLMEISGKSLRALQTLRKKGRLHPISKQGRNFYTHKEIIRFLTEEI